MISFPGSKINIGLHVLDKREDGYHNLESIFYPTQYSDLLEIVKSASFAFDQSGIVIPGAIENNLVYKAYQLLKRDYSLGEIHIHLHKIIPPGSGLGGGSANATACLKILNQLFELELNKEQLKDYALQLGSDCPFFVENQPVFVEGRGEKLSPLSEFLEEKYIKIIVPDAHVSTAEAFGAMTPQNRQTDWNSVVTGSPLLWESIIQNDFYPGVSERHPSISKAVNQLKEEGALYVSMSGSGSSVYGIFSQAPEKSAFSHEWIGRL